MHDVRCHKTRDLIKMDIKLSLVLESKIYRESMAKHLNAERAIEVNQSFSSAIEAIRNINLCQADVLLVDGADENTLQLIQVCKNTPNPKKCIALLCHKESYYKESLADKCVSLGVEGIITNSDSLDDLTACVKTVYSGHLCYPKKVAHLFQNNASRIQNRFSRLSFTRPVLTSRQTIVMQHIANGLSNKEIARTLNIELSTVKNHVHQILERLNVKSRSQAAARFRRPTPSSYS
jgi:DNA-binding NarL/FixJ family response regulator